MCNLFDEICRRNVLRLKENIKKTYFDIYKSGCFIVIVINIFKAETIHLQIKLKLNFLVIDISLFFSRTADKYYT